MKSLLPNDLAAYLLLAPVMLFLVVFYLLPLSDVILLSFGNHGISLANYHEIFRNRANLTILINTFRLALEVTLFCLLLGFPVAYTMRCSSPTVQRCIAALVILPLWTSILVRSYAWFAILGRHGLINELLLFLGVTDQPIKLLYTRLSVYIGMVQIMLPFMILPVFAVLNRIDFRLLSASECLGAGRISTFACVLLPLSISGIAAGSLLVFMISLGFFVTPAILGGLKDITYVMLIEKQVNEFANWNLASAMSVTLLVVSLVLIYLYQSSLTARRPGVMLGRIFLSLLSFVPRLPSFRKTASPENRIVSRWMDRVVSGLPVMAAVVVVFFIAAPVLMVVPMAFSAAPFLKFPPTTWSLRWFENYFQRYDWIFPTLNSLKVAGITMILATVIGSLAAIALVRFEFPGRKVLNSLIISPIILPTIILAVAFYFFFARHGLVGTIAGLVFAHTIIAFPYVLLVVSGSLRSVDTMLEKAALTLGSGPTGAFCRITLPLIKAGILTGAFFAFLTSFDELVIALFVSGTQAVTLPKRMWEGILLDVDPTTLAAAVLLMGLSLLCLAVIELSRRLGHSVRRSHPGSAIEIGFKI